MAQIIKDREYVYFFTLQKLPLKLCPSFCVNTNSVCASVSTAKRDIFYMFSYRKEHKWIPTKGSIIYQATEGC